MIEDIMVGFVLGCIMTYFTLYLPSYKLHKAYQERLENRIKEKL